MVSTDTMRAPRAEPAATFPAVLAVRGLMDLEESEAKPRLFGTRWVLGVREDDGAEMAGAKEEVAAAINLWRESYREDREGFEVFW